MAADFGERWIENFFSGFARGVFLYDVKNINFDLNLL